jgi:hypothetical protein
MIACDIHMTSLTGSQLSHYRRKGKRAVSSCKAWVSGQSTSPSFTCAVGFTSESYGSLVDVVVAQSPIVHTSHSHFQQVHEAVLLDEDIIRLPVSFRRLGGVLRGMGAKVVMT